ncbi:hypothetical protein ACFLSJ_02435 [Verrucomicrobiota bacterium]
MTFKAIIAAAATALLVAPAFSQVPLTLNYQGRLLDAADQPISDIVSVSIGIYTNATEGASVLEQDIGDVPVNNGIYSFSFDITAEALDHSECWLQVSIEGTALDPRQRLLAVPYAVTAHETETETDPHALLSDGSRAMEGDLDVGGKAVTNASSLYIAGPDAAGAYIMTIYAGPHLVAWAKTKD